MNNDLLHVPHPDKQGIRGTRASLVTMPTTLYDKTKIVVLGEIDGCNHIRRALRRDSIGTGSRNPGVGVAGCLCQGRIISYVVGVLQVPKKTPRKLCLKNLSGIQSMLAQSDLTCRRLLVEGYSIHHPQATMNLLGEPVYGN